MGNIGGGGGIWCYLSKNQELPEGQPINECQKPKPKTEGDAVPKKKTRNQGTKPRKGAPRVQSSKGQEKPPTGGI